MTPTHDDHDYRVLQSALADALEGVGKDTGQAIAALRRRGKRNRQMILALGGCVVAVLVALVSVAVLAVGVSSNSDRIGRVQDRTSNQVLCPLYGAFLAAENNPIPPEIKNDPQQMKERRDGFRIIHQGFDELHCPKG
jgi:hypothetical protein